MSSNRLRRIAREIEETKADHHAKVILRTAGGRDDLTHLEGQFEGPPDTPYEGGKFIVDIRIPNDYPFRPPVMKFTTRLWHPNVSSQTGAICLDTISSNWTPVFTLRAALISLQGLLASPEPKDPQDAEVASMMIRNPKEFEQVAREWAVKYAGAPTKADDENLSATAQGEAHRSDQASRDQAAEKRRVLHGYNEALVDRFCQLGFDIPSVVTAFEACGIDKMNGYDFEMDERVMGNVTARLFGDM